MGLRIALAVEVWVGLSLVAAVCFALPRVRAPALSLALVAGVAVSYAAYYGVSALADGKGNLALAEAAGASLGILVGGLLGLVIWSAPPALPRAAMRGVAAAFLLAGAAATIVVRAVWTHACARAVHRVYCHHGPAVFALIPLDAVFLALLVLVLDRRRPELSQPMAGGILRNDTDT